jgi:hypothetical protein
LKVYRTEIRLLPLEQEAISPNTYGIMPDKGEILR